MHRHLIHTLIFLLLSFSACTKNDDNARTASIKFIGETFENLPIVFITEPALNDLSWNFGDGDTSRTSENIPTHVYRNGGNYSVTVSGTKGKRKYTAQTFIYITDSAAMIARKYGNDISLARSWHHTSFSVPNNPGIAPTYTTLNDTFFAYKMKNDSTLFADAFVTTTDNNVVYFSARNNLPKKLSLSYNLITGELSFTQSEHALGGRSGHTYTSF